MFVLPEGAYPTASKRFIEAVRDYRRKLKLQPEPKEGSREWYAYMRGERFHVSSLLQGHFEHPLLYAVLHGVPPPGPDFSSRSASIDVMGFI
jgi:hypothetical protein